MSRHLNTRLSQKDKRSRAMPKNKKEKTCGPSLSQSDEDRRKQTKDNTSWRATRLPSSPHPKKFRQAVAGFQITPEGEPLKTTQQQENTAEGEPSRTTQQQESPSGRPLSTTQPKKVERSGLISWLSSAITGLLPEGLLRSSDNHSRNIVTTRKAEWRGTTAVPARSSPHVRSQTTSPLRSSNNDGKHVRLKGKLTTEEDVLSKRYCTRSKKPRQDPMRHLATSSGAGPGWVLLDDDDQVVECGQLSQKRAEQGGKGTRTGHVRKKRKAKRLETIDIRGCKGVKITKEKSVRLVFEEMTPEPEHKTITRKRRKTS